MTQARGNSRKEPRPDDFSYVKLVLPEMTPQRFRELDKAARAYAERNRSDPFAYGRIFLHMNRGLASIADVLADARPTTV